MRRKFLASILALCMVMSLLPMTAFAGEVETHTASVAFGSGVASGNTIKAGTDFTLKITDAKVANDDTAFEAAKKVEVIATVAAAKANPITLATIAPKADEETVTMTNGALDIPITIAEKDAADSNAAFGSVGTYTISVNIYTTESDYFVASFGEGDGADTLTVTAGDAATLTVTQQPTAPASNGAALATQPKVTVKDAYENPVANVTVTAAETASQNWTLGGTKTATSDASGVATFEGLTATSTAAVTSASITFTATGITGIPSNTFDIPAPKAKPVTTTTDLELTYGETLGSLVNEGAITGFSANASDASGAADVAGTWAITKVGTASADTGAKLDANEYSLTVTFTPTDTTTYDTVTVENVKLTVKPLAIAVKDVTITPQAYDGTNVVKTATVTFKDAADNSDVTLQGATVKVNATFNDKNKGDDKTVTGTVTLEGAKAGNYTLTGDNAKIPEGTKGSITAKEITATVSLACSTDTIAANSILNATVTPTGLVAGDTLAYTYAWSVSNANVDNETSESYTVKSGDSGAVEVTVTLAEAAEGNSNGNYTLTGPVTNSVTIGTKVLSADMVSLEWDSKVYTSQALTNTVIVADGDTDLTENTHYTVTGSLSQTNAGTYTITVTGKTDSGYSGTVTKSFEITKATHEITITPNPTEMAEGGSVTLTVAGLPTGGAATVSCDDDTIAIAGSGSDFSATLPDGNKTYTFTATYAGDDNNEGATATCTVKVGTGSSSGGNNGGGSSGGSTTPTPPPEEPDPNPPSTGEDVTQTVTPDISEGTASATVDKETADKLVSDAVDNKSENVTVKVDVPADADVNEVKADIPASAVADLASKTNAALTVDTPVGNVTIPNKTLAQLGGTSGNVTVTAAVNEDNSVKVEVQANGSTVGALNGGMKVDLPVSQPTAGTVAVLVDAEGNETILPKSAVDGSEVAVLLENGSATIKFVDNAQSFADTDNHWAKNSIAFVSSRNLFQGMENSSFKADVPMNRAMLVTVLHRLESTPAASGGSFDDVPSDSYYATAAAWAAGKGIVTGDDSGFSGDRSVTREEMAVMLYRYVQTINGNKGTLGSYSGMGGANDVSGWASEAMRWAVGSGIIGGDNSGNLNPGSTATRGEVSQMLMNFVKLITK